MVTEYPSNNEDIKEYERFALYPYTVLQDIVARLGSEGYTDSKGRPLADSEVFHQLEKMAFEPPVPDPITAAIAGIIHYLEAAGYKDEFGQDLKDSPFLLPLKQMNVRKLFKSQPDDGLRLLQEINMSSYEATDGVEIRELQNDPAFQELRRIITLEGGGQS